MGGLSNYPPGVTGNEPEITGEWPCTYCGGTGYEEDEDGKHACPLCHGSGIHPEDAIDLRSVRIILEKMFNTEALGSIQFGEENDGYLVIYTDLKQYGDCVRVETG